MNDYFFKASTYPDDIIQLKFEGRLMANGSYEAELLVRSQIGDYQCHVEVYHIGNIDSKIIEMKQL